VRLVLVSVDGARPGDARLADRLISNLLLNGIRHNHGRGRVDLRTATKADRSVVSVANSG
jgi:signal transduction histidine kinase